MTQYLPANLLALFAPRDPLPYLPPPEPKHSKEVCNLVGVGDYVNLFEDPVETPEPQKIPTRAEKKEAKRTDKEDKQKNYIEEELLSWDPHNDANAAGDAFKTVFVARINYDTREDKLRREFEEFGPIRHIHMATDTKTGKHRGYAFIEYETERGMRSAFKYGDGRKIDGKRVVVDIERGRTVKNWRPRRLGGGLGGTRIGAPDQNIAHSGRVEPREYTEKLARASRQRERALRRSKSNSAERGERRASAEPGERERDSSRQTSATKERSPRKEERKRDDREGREDRDRSRRDERGAGGRDRDRDRDSRRSGRDREDRGDRRREDRPRREEGDRDRPRRDDDDRKRGEEDKKRGDDVVQDDDKEDKERDRPARDRSDKREGRDRDDDRKRDRDGEGDRKRDRDDDDRKRDRDDDRDRKRGREDRGDDKNEERGEEKKEEKTEQVNMEEMSEKVAEIAVAPEPIKDSDNGY